MFEEIFLKFQGFPSWHLVLLFRFDLTYECWVAPQFHFYIVTFTSNVIQFIARFVAQA